MFAELTSEQSRQIVDTLQVAEALREAERDLADRLAGSMYWHASKGRRYLYRTIRRVDQSIGPESDETRATYAAFTENRARAIETRDNCRARLKSMGRVNRSLRIGRVPKLVTRTLRRLDRAGLLGRKVKVVGTNALFAYEAAAAIQFQSDVLSTEDLDLLFDARRRLRLLGDADPRSIVGILQKVDPSFATRGQGDFRAVNSEGYMVELIAPEPKDALRPSPPPRNSTAAEVAADLVAAPVPRLVWLENAPPFEAMAFGEDGRPVRIVTVDPRVFAAHKLWLSKRADRDLVKRGRDRQQARATYEIATDRLGLDFDDRFALSACPVALIEDLKSTFGR